MQPFSQQSLKDNFHNIIFSIDKGITFDTFKSTIPIKLFSQKAVIDERRPLEFSA